MNIEFMTDSGYVTGSVSYRDKYGRADTTEPKTEMYVTLDDGRTIQVNEFLYTDVREKVLAIKSFNDELNKKFNKDSTAGVLPLESIYNHALDIITNYNTVLDNTVNAIQNNFVDKAIGIESDLDKLGIMRDFTTNMEKTIDDMIVASVDCVDLRIKDNGTLEIQYKKHIDDIFNRISTLSPDDVSGYEDIIPQSTIDKFIADSDIESTNVTSEAKILKDTITSSISNVISHVHDEYLTTRLNALCELEENGDLKAGTIKTYVDEVYGTLMSLSDKTLASFKTLTDTKVQTDVFLNQTELKAEIIDGFLVPIKEWISEHDYAQYNKMMNDAIGVDHESIDHLIDEEVKELSSTIFEEMIGKGPDAAPYTGLDIEALLEEDAAETSINIVIDKIVANILKQKLGDIVLSNLPVIPINDKTTVLSDGDLFYRAGMIYKKKGDGIVGYQNTGCTVPIINTAGEDNVSTVDYISGRLHEYKSTSTYFPGEVVRVGNSVWEALDVNENIPPASLNSPFTSEIVEDATVVDVHYRVDGYTIEIAERDDYVYSDGTMFEYGDIFYTVLKTILKGGGFNYMLVQHKYISRDGGYKLPMEYNAVVGDIHPITDKDGWTCIGPLKTSIPSKSNPLCEGDVILVPSKVIPGMQDNRSAKLMKFNGIGEGVVLFDWAYVNSLSHQEDYYTDTYIESYDFYQTGIPTEVAKNAQLINKNGILYYRANQNISDDEESVEPFPMVKRWNKIGTINVNPKKYDDGAALYIGACLFTKTNDQVGLVRVNDMYMGGPLLMVNGEITAEVEVDKYLASLFIDRLAVVERELFNIHMYKNNSEEVLSFIRQHQYSVRKFRGTNIGYLNKEMRYDTISVSLDPDTSDLVDGVIEGGAYEPQPTGMDETLYNVIHETLLGGTPFNGSYKTPSALFIPITFFGYTDNPTYRSNKFVNEQTLNDLGVDASKTIGVINGGLNFLYASTMMLSDPTEEMSILKTDDGTGVIHKLIGDVGDMYAPRGTATISADLNDTNNKSDLYTVSESIVNLFDGDPLDNGTYTPGSVKYKIINNRAEVIKLMNIDNRADTNTSSEDYNKLSKALDGWVSISDTYGIMPTAIKIKLDDFISKYYISGMLNTGAIKADIFKGIDSDILTTVKEMSELVTLPEEYYNNINSVDRNNITELAAKLTEIINYNDTKNSTNELLKSKLTEADSRCVAAHEAVIAAAASSAGAVDGLNNRLLNLKTTLTTGELLSSPIKNLSGYDNGIRGITHVVAEYKEYFKKYIVYNYTCSDLLSDPVRLTGTDIYKNINDTIRDENKHFWYVIVDFDKGYAYRPRINNSECTLKEALKVGDTSNLTVVHNSSLRVSASTPATKVNGTEVSMNAAMHDIYLFMAQGKDMMNLNKDATVMFKKIMMDSIRGKLNDTLGNVMWSSDPLTRWSEILNGILSSTEADTESLKDDIMDDSNSLINLIEAKLEGASSSEAGVPEINERIGVILSKVKSFYNKNTNTGTLVDLEEGISGGSSGGGVSTTAVLSSMDIHLGPISASGDGLVARLMRSNTRISNLINSVETLANPNYNTLLGTKSTITASGGVLDQVEALTETVSDMTNLWEYSDTIEYKFKELFKRLDWFSKYNIPEELTTLRALNLS